MRVWIVRTCVAVLLVALGIALGAGPLQLSSRDRDRQLDEKERAVARAEAELDELEAAQEFASDYASVTARELVADTLDERAVAFVRLPGADEDTATELERLLATAGAEVVTDVTLDPALVRPGSRQLVEELTSQVATQLKLDLPGGAGGYARLGLLLARALTADPDEGVTGTRADTTSLGIASGLQTAGLVSVDGDFRRASLTVVLGGMPGTDGSNAVALAILEAFASRTRAVLAAPTAAATDDGLLAAVRADPAAVGELTGIDGVETPMGRVATTLALSARARGTIGQYGGIGPDGPVPPRS